MASIIISERITLTYYISAVQKRNTAVLLRKPGRLASQYAEIAFLKDKEQKDLIEAMNYTQAMPSLSQAQRIKKLSQEGTLTKEKMQDILSETKKGIIDRVTFKNEQLYRFFPRNYSATQMKREILEILKLWISQNWDK